MLILFYVLSSVEMKTRSDVICHKTCLSAFTRVLLRWVLKFNSTRIKKALKIPTKVFMRSFVGI